MRPRRSTTCSPLRSVSPAKAARGGKAHSVVLLANGTVVAFGSNQDGQLGDTTRVDRLVPVTMTGVTAASAIATGATFSIAGAANGAVLACGDNTSGQLGDGTSTRRPTPVLVTGVTTLAQPG